VEEFTFSKSGPITTMLHFIPFGVQSWNIVKPLFQSTKPWAWRTPKAIPGLLFVLLWLISGLLLGRGRIPMVLS